MTTNPSTTHSPLDTGVHLRSRYVPAAGPGDFRRCASSPSTADDAARPPERRMKMRLDDAAAATVQRGDGAYGALESY
jgi:hypothetical protein